MNKINICTCGKSPNKQTVNTSLVNQKPINISNSLIIKHFEKIKSEHNKEVEEETDTETANDTK